METTNGAITLATDGGTLYAPDWPAIAKLFTKIAVAQSSAAAVKKDGKHGQGFTYSTAAEISNAAGDAFAKANLAFTANLHTWTPAEKSVNVRLVFTIADPDSGAMLQTAWNADGQDITKATTTAQKHWLSKTLLLTDHEDQPALGAARGPAAASRPTPSPANGRPLPQPRPQPVAPAQAPATPATPAEAHPALSGVDHSTGEIAAPAIPPLPPDSAPLTEYWRWFMQAIKAAGWQHADLSQWLTERYNVTRPPELNGNTKAAAAALYKALTEEEPLF